MKNKWRSVSQIKFVVGTLALQLSSTNDAEKSMMQSLNNNVLEFCMTSFQFFTEKSTEKGDFKNGFGYIESMREPRHEATMRKQRRWHLEDPDPGRGGAIGGRCEVGGGWKQAGTSGVTRPATHVSLPSLLASSTSPHPIPSLIPTSRSRHKSRTQTQQISPQLGPFSSSEPLSTLHLRTWTRHQPGEKRAPAPLYLSLCFNVGDFEPVPRVIIQAGFPPFNRKP